MKGVTDALPLMQFALKDLFDSQQEKKQYDRPDSKLITCSAAGFMKHWSDMLPIEVETTPTP